MKLPEIYPCSCHTTGSVNETPHRKWRKIDPQPCCWLQLALPGWCLFSPLFPGGVSSPLFPGGVSLTDPVLLLDSTNWCLSTHLTCTFRTFLAGTDELDRSSVHRQPVVVGQRRGRAQRETAVGAAASLVPRFALPPVSAIGRLLRSAGLAAATDRSDKSNKRPFRASARDPIHHHEDR